MHAEKKHKCFKCTNGYSTEWDLKRHIEDCGKTYQCTCGCPYASRAALLSHIYRTGHEIPTEHRHVPAKPNGIRPEACPNVWLNINLSGFLLCPFFFLLQNSPSEKAKDGENVKGS